MPGFSKNFTCAKQYEIMIENAKIIPILFSKLKYFCHVILNYIKNFISQKILPFHVSNLLIENIFLLNVFTFTCKFKLYRKFKTSLQ